MTYSCRSCGYRSAKWMGFCPQCRADEALTETTASVGPAAEPVPLTKVAGNEVDRLPTGVGEFDRVVGGGVVAGSAILVGGEPGVGKSTLLLQVAAGITASGGTVLMASAEESATQVGLRAHRLGISDDNLLLAADTSVEAIVAACERVKPEMLVVDSIQTVSVSDVSAAPGTPTQVRESASRLIQLAKTSGVPVVLVGHVTKDGGLAGPKLLEHMVDVVLYLEGESAVGYRTLSGIKNRFGASHVFGVFEMTGDGMNEVADPSRALIGADLGGVPGTVVFPALQGRRPVTVEVQALVSPANYPQPRRSIRGFEPARVHQLLAVLDRHAGLSFADLEVYVTAVGGMRLREPAADLPIALALASSLLDRPLGPTAAFGEIGLTGEVRSVPLADRRIEELTRLGISTTVAPGDEIGHITTALVASGLVGPSAVP